MQISPTAGAPAPSTADPKGSTRQIAGFVYFTFISYLSIGLPLAVLPPYVHLRLGFTVLLAGLVVSVQYVATLASRPWTGRICDRLGAKVAVLWGMGISTVSGAVLIAAALLHTIPWISLSVLVLSRLLLGIGESLSATGSTLWGILKAGPSSTAKVITFNGIATYGGIAIGAPIGVALDQQWGLAAIGAVTMLICGLSLIMACRKSKVAVLHGEHLPFAHLLGRIAPHGMSLALAGIGYSVLATFVTLYFASRHWNSAALCLTAFGATFIFTRLLFIHAIDRYGGFQVAMACLAVESLALIILWRASTSWMAFAGAALTGCGFSLVFPAIGVEAVKRVPLHNRGAALGIFTAFADVSFFLTGPLAGAIIGAYGYSSVFLFALGCALAAMAIVFVLRQMLRESEK
jgi:MFS family permease